MPIDRTRGCRNCDAGFWKNTPRNIAALGGLVPHQWPPEKRTEKAKLNVEVVSRMEKESSFLIISIV